MLTSRLVRATLRKGVLTPRYIDPDDGNLLAVAESLVAVFEEAAAATPRWTRETIEEAVADCVSKRADPLLFQGFTKLLMDRAEFETTAVADPVALRRTLFERAARSPLRREPGLPWAAKRAEIVREVAAELGLDVRVVESSLFADLEARQRLARFRPLDAPALLQRYNLALAQGVLIRARSLQITLSGAKVGAYRQLFRALKFHQLIHTVTGLPDGGYDVRIDGPLSLFQSATRYGVAMAQFLPTLVATEGTWRLEALVEWGPEKSEASFVLDPEVGLRSHVKARGQYVTEEQKWFEDRFAKKARGWKLSRSAELLRTARGEVVVPDLVFEHPDTGETAYLEILGFWRAGSLRARLAMLDDPALTGLYVAVSKRLAGEEGAPQEHPRLIWFAQVINVGELLSRLDRTPADDD